MMDFIMKAIEDGETIDAKAAAELAEFLRSTMAKEGGSMFGLTASTACRAVPVLFTHMTSRIDELEARLKKLEE